MPNNTLDIPTLITALSTSLQQHIQQRQIINPILIGIHTGGAWIAAAVHKKLAIQEPLAAMDISFYRDDFSQIGVHPKVKPSTLPLTIEGRDIILIDDVFYTGRTIRAALNEIFDYGRPNQVLLGVLIERNGRQIPLRPDCVGTTVELSQGQRIKLSGPQPLDIVIQQQVMK